MANKFALCFVVVCILFTCGCESGDGTYYPERTVYGKLKKIEFSGKNATVIFCNGTRKTMWGDRTQFFPIVYGKYYVVYMNADDGHYNLYPCEKYKNGKFCNMSGVGE